MKHSQMVFEDKKINFVFNKKFELWEIYVVKKNHIFLGTCSKLKDGQKFFINNPKLAERLIKQAKFAQKMNEQNGNNYAIAFYQCGYNAEAQDIYAKSYQKYGITVF